MFSKEVKIPRCEQKKKREKRETHAPHYPAINSVKIKQAQAKNSLIVWPESAAGRGEGRRRGRGIFSMAVYVWRHVCVRVCVGDDDIDRSLGSERGNQTLQPRRRADDNFTLPLKHSLISAAVTFP